MPADRNEDQTISTKRLLDLSLFYLTAGIVGVSKEAAVLARAALPDFVANVDKFFAGALQAHGFKGIARVLEKAQTYPAGSERQILATGQALTALYDVLERKGLLRSTFATTEDATAAMKLSKLAEHLDDDQKLLDLIGSVRLRGVNSRTRKWTRKALVEAGVTAEGFDDLVEEVATATALGQAAAVMGNRVGLDPDAETARQEALGRLDALVEGSSAPEQVLAAAVAGAAAAVGKGPLKTKTGEKLFAGNTQQENAMLVRGKAIIAASAGSGKSRVLAAKVVYHAKELGIPTKQIIATSFTRKSSAELIDRIKKYSGDEGIMRGEARDGFGTTHAVAARILDRYLPDRPKKRKIGPKDQGGEFSPGELYKIALAQVRLRGNGQEPDPNETFFPAAAADVNVNAPSSVPALSWPKAVFKALEWLQTSAADALRRIPRYGNVGPGWDAVESATGIFNKIAAQRLGPEDLSSKQLMRVREVFRAAGMQVDMHDMTARFISAAAKRDFSVYGGEHPTSANQWFNLDAENDPFYAGVEVTARQLGSAITRWKGTMLTPGVVWAQATTPEDKMLAAGYGCYEWLRSNDPAYMPAEDGDDHLIGFCRSLIEDAALRARIQARFKVVLADEAQDLSPCQHLMFGLITGAYDPTTRALREDGKMTADTYAMIGDDRQSIYAFRGADPDVFIDNSDKRGGEFKTNFLTTNYRSARRIVEAANKLIANNTRQIPMVCEVPADRAEGSVRFASHLGWDAASADITSRIKGSIADGSSSYADFGVGVRTNSEGMQLATAMLEAGIPFKSNKFKPLSNYLIKGTLNWMLLGHAAEDETALLNSLVIECSQTPKSGIGKATLEGALDEKAGEDYFGFLSRGGWQQIYKGGSRGRDVVLPFVETMKRVRNAGEVSSLELLQHVLKEVPGLLDLAIKSAGGEDEADEASNEDAKGSGTADGIVDYGVISPLFRLSERFEKPGEFFQYIRQLGVLSKKIAFDDKLEAEDKPNDLNAVTIDTVHGWKGLEVKHMIVPMSSRTFPHMMANIEDERRLAYVAITRGEESVTILSVREQVGDRVLPPSQFVGEMGCSSDGSGVSGSAHDDAWDSLPWHKVIAGWSEMQVDRALTKLNRVLAGASRPRGKALRGAKFPPNPFSAIDLGFDFVEDDDYEPPPESATRKTLRDLERGDVVKIGSTSWAIQMRVDNFTVWAYKWPSKKTKSYQIQLDLTEDGQDVVKVRQITGSAQPIGPVLASGTISPSSVKKKAAGF